MNYFEYTPSPALAPYVKVYWFLEGRMPVNVIVPERIFPDGRMELIIHYGDAFKQCFGSQRQQQPPGFVYGQLEKYIEIMAAPRTGVMGVRFYPAGLAAFTPLPLATIKQQAVELHHLFGKESEQLVEKICEAPTPDKKIWEMERFLLRRLRQPAQQRITAAMTAEVYKSKGAVSVQQLAQSFNVSERQAERLFAQEVGLSPKNFCRIIRFQQIFRLAPHARNLTSLALDAGYFDQAHFTREFKAITGFSPREYFQGQYGLTGYFIDD